MSDQPPHDKPKNNKLYDYSRSSGSSGHWYSGGSSSNPLAGGRNTSKPETTQRRRSSGRSTRVRDRVERRRRYHDKGIPNNWVWMIIVGTMVGMTLISALVLISMSNSNKNTNKAAANSQTLAPTSEIYNDSGALEGNSLVIEPWDGEDRFTVLLMGLDTRPDETNAACRTDTMMIVSIDPVTDRIGILSIPRDTVVEVPNYGLRKINTACVIGNLELNGRGPQLAMQTIQYNFGIEVNDYLMMDFNTFIETIDLIGGIDVNAVQTIDDPEYPDMNYGFDPFYLPAGPHHLDGATALKYARSRYGSDDIDRGRRQQEVVFAVRNRVLSRDMIDDLITRAIPLWNELSDGVETGLSIEQLVRLALYAKDIPDENIHSAVLGWDYLVPHNTDEGTVLVPDRGAIIPLLLDVFGEGYDQ